MSVEIKSVGRQRIVEGHIYIERWVQVDASGVTIYGVDGDLNRLDTQADAGTRQLVDGSTWWYNAPSPGATDEGQTLPAWFGMEIRVPFKRITQSGKWHELRAEIEAFVNLAFPGEQIEPMGRTFTRPDIGDPNVNPAKFVIWTIEYTK